MIIAHVMLDQYLDYISHLIDSIQATNFGTISKRSNEAKC